MIDSIVFSKNRPAQLELFLRTFSKYTNNMFRLNILYDCDTIYNNSYQILIKEYYNFNWIKQNNFKQDLLNNIKEKYCCFFVDDDVWINNLTENLELDNNTVCISLRMHPNISYCYSANFNTGKNIIQNNKWEWKGKSGDWGYPMSLDGHVFMSEDILPILNKLNYNNPNSLEYILSCNPINKNYMYCFEKPKIINIPYNRVQNVFINRSQNKDVLEMNDLFLEGLRLEEPILTNFNSPHVEYEFNWI